jgi:hypothetical protein
MIVAWSATTPRGLVRIRQAEATGQDISHEGSRQGQCQSCCLLDKQPVVLVQIAKVRVTPAMTSKPRQQVFADATKPTLIVFCGKELSDGQG